MAEVVDMDLTNYRQTRNRHYPWDEWLDGQARRLTPGVDFTVDLKSFRAAAWAASNARGRRLITRVEKDSGALLIQAVAGSE